MLLICLEKVSILIFKIIHIKLANVMIFYNIMKLENKNLFSKSYV